MRAASRSKFLRLAPLALAAAVAGAMALTAGGKSADAGSASHGGGAAEMNGPATGKFTAPEYAMGSPKAPVTVVEYLSNTCSHCADYDQHVFPDIKKKYVDTGKVKYVIREFLTPPEPVSAAGFVFARCAGRDKYWPTIEALFRSQPELFQSGDVRGTYLKIAKAMGMSEPAFNQCMADDAALKAVADRVQKATDAKVTGTPTFVFNGKMLNPGDTVGGQPYTGGELSLAQFDAAYAAAGGK